MLPTLKVHRHRRVCPACFCSDCISLSASYAAVYSCVLRIGCQLTSACVCVGLAVCASYQAFMELLGRVWKFSLLTSTQKIMILFMLGRVMLRAPPPLKHQTALCNNVMWLCWVSVTMFGSCVNTAAQLPPLFVFLEHITPPFLHCLIHS